MWLPAAFDPFMAKEAALDGTSIPSDHPTASPMKTSGEQLGQMLALQ
eukprot:CAMPEP_0113526304 /NCGR_PEP_ID=MMETSP0015_2-20120614/664_1 /TAXON_ID=2838 /ORGANISM="Odontella" /LENGTH=46 /DNA_ID=CAMNT_0000424609 /DNA_START=157 /DNA_END=297 /DNA_ORIENTATION=- /assembly_acc=CAM_ASM_000160